MHQEFAHAHLLAWIAPAIHLVIAGVFLYVLCGIKCALKRIADKVEALDKNQDVK